MANASTHCLFIQSLDLSLLMANSVISFITGGWATTFVGRKKKKKTLTRFLMNHLQGLASHRLICHYSHIVIDHSSHCSSLVGPTGLLLVHGWTWSASVQWTKVRTGNWKENQSLHKELCSSPRNLDVSCSVPEVSVTYGITTGPYNETKGGKDWWNKVGV